MFDIDNPINKNADQYLFTTEGHVFPLKQNFRNKVWDEEDFDLIRRPVEMKRVNGSVNCVKESSSGDALPIQSDYLAQIFQQIGAQLS